MPGKCKTAGKNCGTRQILKPQLATLVIVFLLWAHVGLVASIAGPLVPGETVLYCPALFGQNVSTINCTTVEYDPNTPLIPCSKVYGVVSFFFFLFPCQYNGILLLGRRSMSCARFKTTLGWMPPNTAT